jgi:hypothetical protein
MDHDEQDMYPELPFSEGPEVRYSDRNIPRGHGAHAWEMPEYGKGAPFAHPLQRKGSHPRLPMNWRTTSRRCGRARCSAT